MNDVLYDDINREHHLRVFIEIMIIFRVRCCLVKLKLKAEKLSVKIKIEC